MTVRSTWQLVGTVIAIVPIVLLLFFGIGEAARGAGHFFQAIPLGLLTALGWYEARAAGFVLIFSGIGLMFLYAISQYGSIAPPVLTTVELVLFFPMILAGACFLRASYARER